MSSEVNQIERVPMPDHIKSVLKQSNLNTNTHIVNRKNKDTNDNVKTPTNLLTRKYCPWAIPYSIINGILFFIYTCAVIIIGILIVCYATPKPPVEICELNFQQTNKNPIEYNYGPRSVAVGDFDGDTWLDMVVANSIVNTISIYHGYSNGTFSKQIEYSTGSMSSPNMVIVEDINHDSHLDILVANIGTHNVGIFLGNGIGSFMNQKELSTGSLRPHFIALYDLNKDTFLDIVTINYLTDSISIYSNGYGDGFYSNPMTYSTGYDSSPISLVVGDLNNDDYFDIIIANYGTNNILLILGSKNGSFIDRMILPTGYGTHPSSITIGYFNKDNLIDIAVAHYGTNSIGIFINRGNLTFSNQIIYTLQSASPYAINVGDFNRDNRMDLVITNKGLNNVGLFLGYGNGSFTSARMNSTGSLSSISFAICDFNKDNRLDMIIVNNDTGSIDFLIGYFEGFSRRNTYQTDSFPQSIVVADFNKDGKMDIVTANKNADTISVLLGRGDGTFTNQTTYATGKAPISVDVGDFNNDTNLNLVVANSNSSDMSVLLGHDNGSFSKHTTYFTGSSPMSVVVGDFNNDHRLDIVVINLVDNNVCVLLGNGDGSFSNQSIYSNGTGSYSMAVGDFNNDNRLDIVVPNYNKGIINILLGLGNSSFTNQMIYFPRMSPYIVAVGDFNNDNLLDIVVSNYDTFDLSIFLGFGNGSFTDPKTIPVGGQVSSIVVGDINNDTRLDIITVSSNLDDVRLFLGFGNGSFENALLYYIDVDIYTYSVSLADFNGDSRLDIVVASSAYNYVGVLLQYNRGALVNKLTYASGGASQLHSIVVNDINNDTRLDIIVTNYGTDNIGILFGYNNGTFMDQIMIDMGINSSPSSIAINDFNGDSQLDIAVANYGSKNIAMLLGNSQELFISQVIYESGFNFSPIVIASANLNNDKRSEIVVAYDESDNVDILISYNTAFLTDRKTYSTGATPNYVAVGDLNKDHRLDIVVVNYGDNTVSVFLQDDNGTFTNQSIYSTDSNPYFVIICDINNDTNLDIIVVNSGSNTLSILLGYINGSFANQISYSTGTDPESAAVGDFNNDARIDIVVANNGDNTINIFLGYGNGTFHNQKTFSTGIYPQSLAIGDFNNDTRLDVIVTNIIDNNVMILFGTHNDNFIKKTSLKTTNGSRPRSFIIGDFNNDNHLDIGIANSIANNIGIFFGYSNLSFSNQIIYSTGSNSFPSSIAKGDFNNDKQLDIVVANSGSDNVGVFLGYNGSFQNQITYSTGHSSSPSSVSVADFNNDTILDIIVINYDNNNIGILLGRNDGTFVNIILFPLKYGSHPFSLAIGDFNRDKKFDIAVANYGSDNLNILLQTC